MTFFEQAARLIGLFFTQADPLLRVIAFFAAWVGCWLPLAIASAIALNWHPSKPLTAAQKLSLLASLYPIAPLLLWGIAWVEGVSFAHYGLPWNASVLFSLGQGFVLAVVSLASTFGIEWTLGWIHWQGSNWKQLGSVCLPILLLGLWISGIEELVFRGFLLNELAPGGFNEFFGIPTDIMVNPVSTLWVAAAISSAIFSLSHLVWEVQETWPQLLGLWLMGMVLVLARWVDEGNLGLAWGLHAGWIWGIASLDSAQLIRYTGKGSAWIVGLAEKPLAGVAGIICMLGTAVALWIVGD